jgi:hypothetical protein
MLEDGSWIKDKLNPAKELAHANWLTVGINFWQVRSKSLTASREEKK